VVHTLLQPMLNALGLQTTARPLGGATGAVWAVGPHALRIGPSDRIRRELAASQAAAGAVRVPEVVECVDIEEHTGVLTVAVRGGPAGDLDGCTPSEALRRGERCGLVHSALAGVSAPTVVPPVMQRAVADAPSSLLHLDLHPFNILIDADGEPVVIDWANAARGPAVLDVARTATILTFDPAARARGGDPRWAALTRGWSRAAAWENLSDDAAAWALQYLLADLTNRHSPDELEAARTALTNHNRSQLTGR
jgi:hypothetical protein